MKSLGLACGIIASTIIIPQSIKAQRKAEQKKNVLMIVVDDWGSNDLSFSGSKFYETPNIDALSNQSTTFSQAYVAYPRSVPSRYSLFTGMHCARPQNTEKGNEADERKVDENSYCIAEPFQANNYDTFFIGKWHLSTPNCLPENKGFNTNIGGGKAGAPASHFYPFNEVKKGNHKIEAKINNMDDAEPNEYLTDYMSRKMVDYIRSDHDKPFFAVCSYYAVHTPIEAKPEIIQKYKKKKKALGLMEDTYITEEAGVRKGEQNNAVYAAMVESVDQGVGKMIEALKEKGLYENTIIVILSDHGGLSNRGAGNNRELATTNAPLKAGKGHLYEGGIRIPFLIHLPNQKNAVRLEEPVSTLDIFPTMTDLCTVPLAKTAQLDGVSLKKLITNGKDENVTSRKLYWHKASERPTSTGDYLSSAIRSGKYKLIDFYEQNRVELYDIENDPNESKNLINEEPSVAQSLLTNLNQWKEGINVNKPKPQKSKSEKQEKQAKKKNKVNKNKSKAEADE